jgi:hypothetical protein
VALGKMLNIGGMENSSPKTAQNPNRFRVARNVKPNPQGVISPRNSFTTPSGQPSNIKRYPLLTQYNTSILKMAVNSSDIYNYYLNNTLIPRSSFQGGAIGGGSDNTSLAVMSFRKNNTTYILNPLPENSFFKYDGVEITGCGSPQPRFSCASYLAAGTQWVKVIQHRVDFDNNEPASETVTFPIDVATNLITLRTDSGATNIVSPTNPNVDPPNPVTQLPNTMSDIFFIGGAAVFSAGNNDITVTVTNHNLSTAAIGSYIFLGKGATVATSNTFWTTAECGSSTLSSLLALRIKSFTAGTVVLDCLNAKSLRSVDRVWENFTAGGAAIVATGVCCGFRRIFTVWNSFSLTGDYTLRRIGPAFPEATVTTNLTVDLLSIFTTGTIQYSPVAIGITLGDWYDQNTRKLCISTSYNFGGTFLGLTSYQDQILWWTDDLIYFPDPNLGGSVEHPSAGSFIRVGDSEFGQIVSVCGSSDFFVVSRERKNYIVNGNLATGNYRVQDISDIEIGAWCNNGMINIKDSVIMINALGVWQIQSGGRVSHLSKQIAKNFATYQPSGEVTDTWFSLLGTTSFPIVNGQDFGLDIAFDEYSELLFFCQRSIAGTPMLVIHTKTGEFYEWTGVVGNFLSRGLVALNGVLYCADVNGTSSVVKAENKSGFYTQDYAVNYPIQLYTTWLTGGEPSLEKQLLQLKMFGYVYTTADRFRVVHFKDWDEQTKITNASYVPDKSTYPLQYSHLKRLNSDKVLAASVGIEISQTNTWFELESIEVEFNPIQQGVKR